MVLVSPVPDSIDVAFCRNYETTLRKWDMQAYFIQDKFYVICIFYCILYKEVFTILIKNIQLMNFGMQFTNLSVFFAKAVFYIYSVVFIL